MPGWAWPSPVNLLHLGPEIRQKSEMQAGKGFHTCEILSALWVERPMWQGMSQLLDSRLGLPANRKQEEAPELQTTSLLTVWTRAC